MTKLAIFAHFSPDNTIEDYVIYYLRELKKVVDDIIFVSDCNVVENELEKIKKYTTKIIAKTHGEYDFGSYKYGYLFAKENKLLENLDELIFANDSCYAPLYDFKILFKNMNSKNCDYWGITANPNGIDYLNKEKNELISTKDYHIQSYFLCFKKQIFQNTEFDKFMQNIKKEKNKIDVIINYEIGLSKLLNKYNFKPK